MSLFHAYATKRLFPGIVRCGRVCANRSPSCSSGTSPRTGVAEVRHRWARRFGSTTGISEFVAGPRGRTWPSFKPNMLPLINRRVAIEVSGEWLFENGTRAIPMSEPRHPRDAADIQPLLTLVPRH
jgi:hypothetical protein